MWFKETLSHKKKFLSSLLKAPMEQLASLAPAQWNNADGLTEALSKSLCRLPHCELLYAVDHNGKQVSANVARNHIDHSWLEQDLSMRPYLSGSLPYKGMILSSAYLSQRSMQPCITAVQAVRDESGLVGFVVADFHLKDIPNTLHSPLSRKPLSKYGKSDGYINGVMDHLKTSTDSNIDYLIYVLTTLVQEHGIFHFQLHFNTEQCCLWSIEDPVHYQIHDINELMDPELLELYSKVDFPEKAVIDSEKVTLVLAQFKALREMDNEIYLQSGSLNIMNGMVNIALSSSNSQYLSATELLNKDLAYWLDQNTDISEPVEIATPN